LTLGFLVDPQAEFLIHVLREPAPGARQLPAAEPTTQDELRLARLTPRQRQVLDLLCAGATSAEIARRLVITHTTARNHVQNVLVKLGVHSRLEAALLAGRPRPC
jgi:two-component system nitrate/nitrite response regulator NarL